MADEDDEVRQSIERGREKGEKKEFGVKVVYLDSNNLRCKHLSILDIMNTADSYLMHTDSCFTVK